MTGIMTVRTAAFTATANVPLYAPRKWAAVGNGTGLRATHVSAFSFAGSWRGLGAPNAAPMAAPTAARSTAGGTAPATALAAASDKRYLVKKNGTQLYKGSSPWRLPV